MSSQAQLMNSVILYRMISLFLHSLLKILTQEDWNKVLYNGMASTSPVAALYFIALMTFGNYVLFNLLVAILVEGFQTEVGWHRAQKGKSLKTDAMRPLKETYFLWIIFPGLNTNIPCRFLNYSLFQGFKKSDCYFSAGTRNIR